MKSTIFALLAAASPLVAAHYTIPGFSANGVNGADWQYVRTTANHYSNGPVTNVKDQAIRCYELDYNSTPGQTQTATVSAGSSVTIRAGQAMYHPGTINVYMSKATKANSVDAGKGQTWFKVFEQTPTGKAGDRQLTFSSASASQTAITFTIPRSVPSGEYLIRTEQVALHSASSYGGAQFYISCAQVAVTGGGSGSPSPLVSFPGAYTGYEPGFLINIYNLPSNFTGYISPGPKVWSG